MGFDPLCRKGILKRMCYHDADLVEGLRIVDISFAYRHYLIPRRSLKNALTEKGSGYYLNKFKKPVDKFYKDVIERFYKSEVVVKYQDRFVRYQDSLFTFLDYDGVPWHNNTSERAIRHLAKQRVISGNFHESGARSYLVLLGVRQTCRSQGKSFLKFLFSEEKDIDNFKVSKCKW